MYRLPVYAMLAASGLLLTAGCSRNNTTARQSQGEASREAPESANNQKTAYVRYVSTADAHTNTDLYFGDLRLFSTVEAKTPTEYKQVPAERRDFALRAAGSTEGMAIENNSEGLSDGKHYTVLLCEDQAAKPVLKVFNDDESAPAAGKAKLRIIDAAPGEKSVSVYAPGRKDKLADESRFSAVSSWKEVDPVNGSLEVRTGSGNSTQVTKVSDMRIEPGKLYTLIVEGGPRSAQKLHVVPMVDNPTKG